jgi:hypothetical protein
MGSARPPLLDLWGRSNTLLHMNLESTSENQREGLDKLRPPRSKSYDPCAITLSRDVKDLISNYLLS